MLVVLVVLEEVVLVVLSDEVDDVVVVSVVFSAVVSVTLGALSVVEGSSVVWAASAVVSVVVSPALWADTRAVMASTSRKRRMKRDWECPNPLGRSRMVTRP
jgi:hypothetical protein